MIKDYELLNKMDLLYAKRLVIWGVGKRGKELADKLCEFTQEVEFVDTDPMKRGTYYGLPIYMPEKIAEYPPEKTAIVISTDNVLLQKNILSQIEDMNYCNIDIYTRFAVQAVLCFMENRTNRGLSDRMLNVLTGKLDDQQRQINSLAHDVVILKQMTMAQMTEKTVYIYQSKKVASSSIARSVRLAGMNGFHLHDFNFRMNGFDNCFIRDMIRKTSGKVISIVREPIARQISLLWQYWGATDGELFLKKYNSLEDLEADFFAVPNREDEFEWYRQEFQNILNINIYEYPFDRDLGYSIIEKDGISLLMLKMEKIDSLEKVIGSFLGVEKFSLIKGNIASEKQYCYAYKNYLENVKIPTDFALHYYNGNKYMDYFYTAEEKKEFCERWNVQGV